MGTPHGLHTPTGVRFFPRHTLAVIGVTASHSVMCCAQDVPVRRSPWAAYSVGHVKDCPEPSHRRASSYLPGAMEFGTGG